MKKSILLLLLLSLALAITAQPFSTRSEWETYFNTQRLDPIEGIWSMSITERSLTNSGLGLWGSRPEINTANNIEIAIFRFEDMFWASTLNAEQVPIIFRNTAIAGMYIFQCCSETFFRITWNNERTSLDNFSPTRSDGNAVLTENVVLEFGVTVRYTETSTTHLSRGRVSQTRRHWRTDFSYQLIKLFPTATSSRGSGVESSGTGWALSRAGHIVTNHHVIDGARDIQVRGINGDFSRTHKAEVVIQDIVNDIAILKVPVLIGAIPYTITTTQASVGTNIFALGYPLISSMGDELKVTNGIISARSGFQGDITNYQISAPVQPGNSGGPLFDNKGNVIGIVTAGHTQAQNANYAVKSSYLMKVIESMDTPPALPATNTISSMSLADQVSAIRRFVYIIEVK